jgi:2'-5' RNA ligase
MSVAALRPLSHRYFFALKPDEVTARRTRVFAEEQLGDAKGLLEPHRHHVTLAITDDFANGSRTLVEALLRAGEAVRAAPFDLALDRLSINNGSVALRPGRVVQPLRELQGRIATAMRAQGVPMRGGWQFSQHETLAYRKGIPATRPIEPFHWTVTRFVLIHSMVGLHRHETIGDWELEVPEEEQGSLF